MFEQLYENIHQHVSLTDEEWKQCKNSFKPKKMEKGNICCRKATFAKISHLSKRGPVFLFNRQKGKSACNTNQFGRLVDAYNRVDGIENIYAIGDACLQKTDMDFPDGHPQLATVAMQQGATLAKNFIAMNNGKSLTPFKYFD